MDTSLEFSRRGFLGGLAAVAGYLGLTPEGSAGRRGGGAARLRTSPFAEALARQQRDEDYDKLAHLNFNENPWGPPASVMDAMTGAFKYANRYGYPDGGIQQEIAKLHGVERENVILGAGSGELLDVVGATFLENGRKVVGVEPTYSSVYSFATGIKADVIRVPLLEDYRQDIPAMIRATRRNYRDVGFVYLCNPNNPTGRVVSAAEVKQLLDGIPEDVPVLIDEAYHHFVDDPAYASADRYVKEGRQVIVTRTFSKISALAGMRLGYGLAPVELIRRMRPHATGSINAVVKWGGVAALKDTAAMARVRGMTLALRRRTMAALQEMGYATIPSETNFFMVDIGREVEPVIREFRKKLVAVGRPFPPMTKHLRISVGSAEEMERFMAAFRQVVPAGRAAAG